MGQQIHWFPGHMKKALNQISQSIKLVDVVVEILDARAPLSSINDQLSEIIGNKKHIIILSKIDLADPTLTTKWINYLKEKYEYVLALNLLESKAQQLLNLKISELGKEKQNKQIAKGMKPQPIKVMIVGISNVGKSSLINRLAKKKVAGVENRPGFTRGEQWVKINNDFILLDTPGVLPSNYEDKSKAINLALIGSIRNDILPSSYLAEYLLTYLQKYYPQSLLTRFGIETINDFSSVINQIASKRGIINQQNDIVDRACQIILNDFKDGKLGRITLEQK